MDIHGADSTIVESVSVSVSVSDSEKNKNKNEFKELDYAWKYLLYIAHYNIIIKFARHSNCMPWVIDIG